MNDLAVRQVPFFGLDRQYRRYRDNFLAITDRVLSSGQVLQGPDVTGLERELAQICGRRHGVAVGSCTDALAFALKSCDIGPGDEVLVTSLSFVASASPILRVGARPCFVDIAPDTFLMDIETLDRLVTPATRAILAVHMFGQTLPMSAIEAFAARRGLVVIEDAAQALGAMDGLRPAGNLGRVSCISFDPTKVIGSFSSAGALVTDDEDIAERARRLRYHGREPQSRLYEEQGYNSQLSSEMAAMLRFKLSHLAQWQAERTAIAQTYIAQLADVAQLRLPQIRPGSSHNWHKFVLRVPDRQSLAAALTGAGIQTAVHYPRALPDEPVFGQLELAPSAIATPNARVAVTQVLSLPVYPDLAEIEVQHVCRQIRNHYAANNR